MAVTFDVTAIFYVIYIRHRYCLWPRHAKVNQSLTDI